MTFELLAAMGPQLITAALLYVDWTRKTRTRFLAPLLAPLVFLVVAFIDWSRVAHEVAADGGEPACGAFGAMALVTTSAGAVIHCVVASALLVAWLFAKRVAIRVAARSA